MEQWEIDLREKLEKELPDGGYQIGSGMFEIYTGKSGKIAFEVELEREIRNRADYFKPTSPIVLKNPKLVKDVQKNYPNIPLYLIDSKHTADQVLENFMNDLHEEQERSKKRK